MENASPASSPGRRLYVGLAMTFSALVVLSPILGTKVVNLAGIKFTAGIFTILFALVGGMIIGALVKPDILKLLLSPSAPML